MLCKKPYKIGVKEYGCGHCGPCLVNRKRLWTGRLMLESQMHPSSVFVTLTYDPEHYPSDGSVDPRALVLFFKRLRFAIAPRRIRYFAVGEYGDRTFRAHYHVVLFGECSVSEIESAWSMGHVHVGTVTQASAAYVCGYVTKSMTRKEDERLKGRHPEFARMSTHPGIGALAMKVVADAMVTEGGCEYIIRTGDVAGVVRQDGRVFPLGRYLKSQLRLECGFEDRTALASDLYGRQLQAELGVPGALQAREEKRLQLSRIAEGRERMAKLKRGRV